MRNAGRISWSAAAAVALLVVAPAGAQTEPVVLRFAHEAPETAIKGQTAERFSELVAEYSEGTLKVEVYPGAQLLPTTEEVRAAIRGQVDIIAPQTSYFSSLDPAFDVFYQPLLFDNVDQAFSTVAGEFGRNLLDRLDRVGLMGLGIWHDGPGYLFVKGDPVVEPADLEGRKIRVFPSAPLEEGVRAVGATPISMPAPEVFLALQQGVVEGVVTTPTYAAPAQWYEALDSMTRLMMFIGGYGVVINQDSWEKLSAEHQDVLMRAMSDAEEWNYNFARENLENAEQTLAEQGLEIVDVTPEQLSAWQEEMEAVYSKQPPEVRELIEEVRSTN